MSADEQASGSSKVAIGISFGNSNSSIAFTNPADGKAEVIANEEGDRQIPTILSYVSGEEFQGTQAKSQLVRNPRNTIAYFRDFLGKSFDGVDVSPCHASAHAVKVDDGKRVGFQVQERAATEAEEEEAKEVEKVTLSVDEVATRHLRRLKQSASDYLGKEISAAVITVPSNFGDKQKAALTAAAQGAGLEVLQYMSEPVSALLAHDAKQQQTAEDSKARDQIVLVADLGGTRSDVALIASRGGMYTTLATAHDYELGGAKLDDVLIDYAAKEFLKKNKNASDPRTNERSLAKLKLEAESVRKALSLGSSAAFSIESLADGIDFSLTVNRTRYELLANKVFMAFMRLMESVVQKADLDILDVDTILLSGGTSHTPKIASNLQARFPEPTIVVAPSTHPSAINPSELVARGAAIQASLVSEFERSDIEASTEAVVTVTPHLAAAIGLVAGSDGQQFLPLIAPETPAPSRRTVQIPVPAGGDVLVQLAEGERTIEVHRDEPRKANGEDENEEDDEDDEDSDEEPEEIREKIWKPGKSLAEAAIRGIKKGGKIEVQVNVAADLTVTMVCREVGGKGGIRGNIEPGKIEQNGHAA